LCICAKAQIELALALAVMWHHSPVVMPSSMRKPPLTL
jgi:hypothetical protein